MDLYSPGLTVAFIAGGLSVATALLSRAIAEPIMADKWGRASRLLAGVALIAGIVAGVTHVISGHPPGSPEGLGPGEFVSEHPALLGVAAVAGVGIWVSR